MQYACKLRTYTFNEVLRILRNEPVNTHTLVFISYRSSEELVLGVCTCKKCVTRLTFADLYCTVSIHVHVCLHLRPHTDRHTHRGYITIDQV